jgi:protocatechuate 3,4-dioxygenase beta subunit
MKTIIAIVLLSAAGPLLMLAGCTLMVAIPSVPNAEGCEGTLTPSEMDGPFYKAGSPERTNLYDAAIPGGKLSLSGFIYNTECKPIAHAWIDFWQADGKGQYDNSGYTLRGHQYTEAAGKYMLETVIPGEYTGRTLHIHVKVRANDNAPELTTQLYMPGVQGNQSDFLFNPALLMQVKDSAAGKSATFNFVIKDK